LLAPELLPLTPSEPPLVVGAPLEPAPAAAPESLEAAVEQPPSTASSATKNAPSQPLCLEIIFPPSKLEALGTPKAARFSD
jgi:hypothetical protein